MTIPHYSKTELKWINDILKIVPTNKHFAINDIVSTYLTKPVWTFPSWTEEEQTKFKAEVEKFNVEVALITQFCYNFFVDNVFVEYSIINLYNKNHLDHELILTIEGRKLKGAGTYQKYIKLKEQELLDENKQQKLNTLIFRWTVAGAIAAIVAALASIIIPFLLK